MFNVDQMDLNFPKNDEEQEQYKNCAQNIAEMTVNVMTKIMENESEKNKSNALSQRDIEAFKKRMFENYYQDEIGEALGVTRSRIGQILDKCERKFKNNKVRPSKSLFENLEDMPQEKFLNTMYWGIEDGYSKNFRNFLFKICEQELENRIDDRIKSEESSILGTTKILPNEAVSEEQYNEFAQTIKNMTVDFLLESKLEEEKLDFFKLNMFENKSPIEIGRLYKYLSMQETKSALKAISKKVWKILEECKEIFKTKNAKTVRERYYEKLKVIPQERFLKFMYWGIEKKFSKSFRNFILRVCEIEFEDRIDEKIKFETRRIRKKVIHNEKSKLITEKLLNNIIYPAKVNYDAGKVFEKFEPLRKTSDENNNGEIEFCLNGVEKKVEYESFQESFVIDTIIEKAILENSVVADLKTQCIEIEYSFSGKKHKYYPDLALLMTDGSIVLVEVKPPIDMYDKWVLTKYDAMKDYCKKHSFGYAMIDGRFESIEYKINKANKIADQDKVTAFVNFIRQQGEVGRELFDEYKAEFGIGFYETLKAVMDNKDIQFTRKFKFAFKHVEDN